MFLFENIIAYQKALLFTNQVYKTTTSWPKIELFGLTDQIRRACVSIGLNIAEGSSRSRKEFRHFLDMARGSCFECVSILTVARNQGYINLNQYSFLYAQVEELAKIIQGLKKSLV